MESRTRKGDSGDEDDEERRIRDGVENNCEKVIEAKGRLSTRCSPRPGRGKIRQKSERIEEPAEIVEQRERKKERKRKSEIHTEEGSTTYYLVA